MLPRPLRPAVGLLLALGLASPGARARDAGGNGLSGRDVYERLLANRFDAFEQRVRLVSGDRAGNEQESRMMLLWKSFRAASGAPSRGVLSKTRIRYTHPFDLRFSGYLVINNHDGLDDQFVYLASRRRVKRVNLRSEPVMGSDFSFEDVVPREIEDASYERLPDETLDGRPCHVVEVTPDPAQPSGYSRFRTWVDAERWVALRTLYWDLAGVGVKELHAPAGEMRAFDGVWVPMRTEMRNLVSGSYTHLTIDELVANPAVDDGEFDPRRLESH
jgi:outer membrane lipoprotein-sorting protein